MIHTYVRIIVPDPKKHFYGNVLYQLLFSSIVTFLQ